jgi:eukaryotic-like serine/threonine-protein kinase
MPLIKNRYITQAEWQSDIFSTTFTATHQGDGRSLLITQIHDKWLTSVLVETLLQTCQKLSGLRHPAIATMLDYHFDGRNFFVIYDVPSHAKPMEVVIRAERGWPADKHIALINHILDGLVALESHGQCHGHVNFMTVWMVNGEPLLAHAKIYAQLFSANISKIPTYNNAIFLAPDTLTGQAGTTSGDIFSVGAMLYILLSHRWPVPYTAQLAALIKAHQTGIEPFQPVEDVPPFIHTFLRTSLSGNSEARFKTLSDCQQALIGRVTGNPSISIANPILEPSPRPAEPLHKEPILPVIPISKRYVIGIPLISLLALIILYTIYNLYMTALPIKVVPDVEGLSVAEATERLEAMGLRATVSGSRVSMEMAPGHVLESRPAAGREVKQSRLILLFIAKRAEELQVPDFQGRSWTQALALASEVGIHVTALAEEYSATVDMSYVITQDTTPNITVSPNVSIGLTLSKGYPVSVSVEDSAADNDIRQTTISFNVPEHWPSQTIVVQHQIAGNSRSLFSKVCEPGFEKTIVQALPLGSSIQVIYNNKTAGAYVIKDPAETLSDIPSDNEETQIPPH